MVYGLVLAAGFGSRLGYDMPKALIPWGAKPALPSTPKGLGAKARAALMPPKETGPTILDHQLDHLARAGIGEIWIVVGFQARKVKAHVGKRPGIRFVENKEYMDTQNGKSMLVGLQSMPAGGVVTLNADVVFDPGIVEDLIAEPDRSSFAAIPKVCGEEEMKYRVAEGRLQAVSKQVHGEGELIGINYIAPADRPLLERALAYNDAGQYYERSFDQMLPFTKHPVRVLPITPRRAMEIDFPEDLEAARLMFAP
ncbi:MAG TPA: NTP transferase domain-containing protein [Candidatus Thermoplasmatota archaeon]|nr:NTP transferase domain-containing protein [Candidatus Thermoplasmatota archaeon]